MNWRNEWKKLAGNAEAATKALGAGGQVKTVGKIPSPDEIRKMPAREQE